MQYGAQKPGIPLRRQPSDSLQTYLPGAAFRTTAGRVIGGTWHVVIYPADLLSEVRRRFQDGNAPGRHDDQYKPGSPGTYEVTWAEWLI